MNLVFNIARTYEYEFTSNNLIKSDMVIDRVAMKGSGDVTGVCLVLDRVNNMQERRQSPLVVYARATSVPTCRVEPRVHGECAYECCGSQKSQMVFLIDR